MENGSVLVRPSVKYIDDIVALMQMHDAKTAPCPNLMEERPERPEDDKELDADEGALESRSTSCRTGPTFNETFRS